MQYEAFLILLVGVPRISDIVAQQRESETSYWSLVLERDGRGLFFLLTIPATLKVRRGRESLIALLGLTRSPSDEDDWPLSSEFDAWSPLPNEFQTTPWERVGSLPDDVTEVNVVPIFGRHVENMKILMVFFNIEFLLLDDVYEIDDWPEIQLNEENLQRLKGFYRDLSDREVFFLMDAIDHLSNLLKALPQMKQLRHGRKV